MKHLLLLSFLLITTTLAVGCGRCVLQGDICQFDSCTAGLTCVDSFNGLVPICLPSVNRGQFCNGTQDYDPCITDFYCNRTSGNCELAVNLRGSYSYKGDGCAQDYYCAGTMTCQNGVCAGSLPSGQCASPLDCTWNQYCDLTNTPGTCSNLPTAGQSCQNGQCAYGSTCKVSGTASVCSSWFSVGSGSGCQNSNDCQSGLTCNYNGICVQPAYSFFIGPQGISWGGACYPGETGCTCDYGLANFQYLRETQDTITQNCVNQILAFGTCMGNAKCFNANTHADSCMRKNCWNAYLQAQNCGTDPSLVGPSCGTGASLVVGFLLGVFMLVL